MYHSARKDSPSGWKAISANSHHATNIEDELDSMARQACKNAFTSNKSNNTFSQEQSEVFITSVSKALNRAASNSHFTSLPKQQQHEAAKKLAEQFMDGQKLVDALLAAMNNPSTLAAQLISNANTPEDINVFDRIVKLNSPKTTMNPSTISHMGSKKITMPTNNMSMSV